MSGEPKTVARPKAKRNDARDIIRAAKSWTIKRRKPVSLAPVDLRYYAPGLDPDDVTGGNGDG